MLVNLEYLKTFFTVVETDSFSRAGDILFISQSAVSKRILELEKELGIQLIIRDKRNSHIALTSVGKTLYDECLPYIKGMDGIEQKIHNIRDGVKGKLDVCNLIFYCDEISYLCRKFNQNYPNAQLSFWSHNFDTTRLLISKGVADLGFIFSTYFPRLDFEVEKLNVKQDRYTAFFPKKHKYEERTSISIGELSGENLICCTDSPLDFIQDSDLKPSKIYDLPPESLILKVQEGVGYSIAPRMALNKMEEYITILEIEGIDTTCDIYLIWKPDNANPLVSRFVDTVKAESFLNHTCAV